MALRVKVSIMRSLRGKIVPYLIEAKDNYYFKILATKTKWQN